MKFYTKDWYSGEWDWDDPNGPWFRYQDHLKRLSACLPRNVFSIIKKASIHDGLMHSLQWDRKARSLAVCYRCGDLQVGYYDLQFKYFGARVVIKGTHSTAALIMPSQYEALDDEFDVTRHHRFVHRVQFTDDVELDVYFNSFRYRKVSKADRKLPNKRKAG